MKNRQWILAAIVGAVLLWLFLPAAYKIHKLSSQSQSLEAEIQRLEMKNQILENELKLLQNDPVYIEHVARKTFNKTRDGELIYKVVPAEEAPRPAAD